MEKSEARKRVMACLYLAACLSSHLAHATTRYLPSPSSASPWLAVSSALYSQPLPAAPSSPHSDALDPSSPHSDALLPSSPSPSERLLSGKGSKPSQDNAHRSSSSDTAETMSQTLQRDLKKLGRLLPGVYTNMQQYRQEAGTAMPREQRHVLLRSSYRPVELSFLPRAFCVLAQDFSGDSLFPFRQRVYSFSVDVAHRAIRMTVWTFATQRLQKKATLNLHNFRKLRRKDLMSQDSCDMFWRRLDRTTFMGITGKRCLGYVKGEQVRITVSMTLTWQLLQTNEGWYRARDGKTLVEVDVPYNLLRTKTFPANPRKKQTAAVSATDWRRSGVTSTQNDLPVPGSLVPRVSDGAKSQPARPSPKKPTGHNHQKPVRHPASLPASANSKRTTKTTSSAKRQGDVSRGRASGSRRSGKHRNWILPDFDAIAKALHSGHVVFYSVELSACSLPAQMKAERLSFGDFVDSFQSTPPGKDTNQASIRFWQSKFVEGDDGLEKLTREIVILSSGKVTVRLHRQSAETGGVAWDHSAQCRLFDSETGLGGVKMTSRPVADVHEITTFGRFRAALRKGRRQVRMIIDLTHCDGRARAARDVLGTTVRAYDFMNGGRAVEVSLLTPSTDHSHSTLLTGHFLHNGEVVFITSLQVHGAPPHSPRHHPLLYHSDTFRCALIGSDVTTNNGGPRGVRLFYST